MTEREGKLLQTQKLHLRQLEHSEDQRKQLEMQLTNSEIQNTQKSKELNNTLSK